MARPKGKKETKKRKRVYISATKDGPKSQGISIPSALTLPEQLMWNKYERDEKKQGGEALFDHPNQMLIAALSYFRWCANNPIYVSEPKMYKGKIVYSDKPMRRPYLITNFCHYCGVTGGWFRDFRARTNLHPEFASVIEFVDEACRTQQIEGAMVNQFNPNLVMMMNGLYHKEEVPQEPKTAKQIPELRVYNTAPPLHSSEEDVEAEIISSKPLNGKHK